MHAAQRCSADPLLGSSGEPSGGLSSSILAASTLGSLCARLEISTEPVFDVEYELEVAGDLLKLPNLDDGALAVAVEQELLAGPTL